MNKFIENLWIERYRPKTFEEYICTDSFREMIEDWTKDNRSNLFFESSMGGNGKTTLAKLLAEKVSGQSVLFINASENGGIETIRNIVTGFASRKSLNGAQKTIILDEIDNMPAGSLKALRGIIEQYAGYVRFIVTCNDLSRLDETTKQPFKNRFSQIDFNKVHGTDSEERKDIALKMFERAIEILEENNVKYDEEAIVSIIRRNFKESLSFRGVVQDLQDFSKRGVTVEAITGKIELELTELLNCVHRKDLKPVREFVHNNSNRGVSIIEELESNIEKYFNIKSDNFLNVFFVLRECLDRLKGCELPEIPLLCMFLELGSEGVFNVSVTSNKNG